MSLMSVLSRSCFVNHHGILVWLVFVASAFLRVERRKTLSDAKAIVKSAFPFGPFQSLADVDVYRRRTRNVDKKILQIQIKRFLFHFGRSMEKNIAKKKKTSCSSQGHSIKKQWTVSLPHSFVTVLCLAQLANFNVVSVKECVWRSLSLSLHPIQQQQPHCVTKSIDSRWVDDSENKIPFLLTSSHCWDY